MLEFSLRLEEIPVTLKDSNGQIKKCVLKEFDGLTRDAFLNSLSGRVKKDDKGKAVEVKDFDGYQASLITLCLFDEQGKNLSKEEIQKFPAKVIKSLFKEAQTLNGLDEKAPEIAKKD